MYNILLTGGSGFFGNYLKSALEKIGVVTTIGISDSDDLHINLVDGTPELASNYDFVVHAAGKAHVVPKTEDEENLFFDVNYKGTLNLLIALEKSLVLPRQFIFISSVAVYGLETGVGIGETDSLNATDAYGRSKIDAENAIIEWGKEHGVTVTILRLPLLIGKDAPGNLGAMINAITKGRFAIIGSGGAKRSMVYAGDVAKFIPEIAAVGGVYNLTDGYHPSFKELAEVIGSRIGIKPYRRIPFSIAGLLAKAGDMIQKVFGVDLPFSSRRLSKMTSSLTFDDTKARAVGWTSSKVLEIGEKWLGDSV